MRLIDADVLIEQRFKNDISYKAFVNLVKRQPTIEARKRGMWKVYKASDKQHCALVECPFCGENMIAEADEYSFCPNCGADMRGKQDETD